MGDSACLMQPFCYASGLTTNDSNERNPIHALGQSVSFGRFVTESLAWEKWSSFSHNRYVEEAERFSKPGSVAQKKAFFEAHYKKLAAQKAAAAAAAFLEQSNNAAAQSKAVDAGKLDGGVIDDKGYPQNSDTTSSDDPAAQENSTVNGGVIEGIVDGDDISVHDSATMVKEFIKEEQSVRFSSSEEEEQGVRVSSSSSEQSTLLRSNDNDSGLNVEASVVALQRSEVETEQEARWRMIESQNRLEDFDARNKVQTEKISVTPPIMTPILKKSCNYVDQEVSESIGKKKPSISSFKLLKANNGTSKVTSTPVKSTVPLVSSSKRDNIIATTPMSNNKKHATATVDGKRSTPKSHQMSVNFTPIRELNRLTASVMRRFESVRGGAAAAASSKDTMTPLRTPIMSSKKEMQKHSILTPLTEKRRNKTPLDLSSTGNHTGGPKWRLPSTENKMRSPIVISSPFSLRTEERAARRQKKLEEKFNAKFNGNEAQKVQLHTKLKEKAETEIRKLRQSFCFKARPLPDFYKERKASNSETKKDPLTHSESTQEGRKPGPSVAESRTFLTPPQRPSLKSNVIKSIQAKSGRGSTLNHHHHLTSNSMMINTHENTSPNIQLRNRNDRYYK